MDYLKKNRHYSIRATDKVWKIPLKDIESAEMLLFGSLYGKGQVLKIRTHQGIHYQFGMQINPEWETQEVLPITFRQAKLRYSWFSLLIRLFLVGYLLYLFINS